MFTFGSLPFHVKEQVFGHVLLEDRYETGKVSSEWFQLTVSTYSFDEIRSSDQLLENLVMFYNKNHNDRFESIIDLFESRTNFRASLSHYNFDLVEKYAAYIKEVRIHSSNVQGFQPLFQSLPIADRCRLVDRELVTVLKEGSTQPHTNENESFPKLRLLEIRTGGRSLVGLEIHLEWITECNIDMCNSVEFIDHLVSVLGVLKVLKKLALVQVLMCKKLHQSLPENLTHVFIQVSDIESELLPVFGSPEVCGRNVMFFMCRNWRKICRFEANFSQPRAWYNWLRKQKTEALSLVNLPEHSTGPSGATAKYKNLDLCNEYVSLPSFGLLKVPPASIRLAVKGPRTEVNLEDLCCHLPRLECLSLSGCPNLTLNAIEGRVTSLLTFSCFEKISLTALATIITACPFLHTIKVRSDPKVSWKMPDNAVSKSLRKLRIYDFSGDVGIILNHFPKLQKCSLPMGKKVKLSAEAMSQLKVFSTTCNYNRKIWNQLRKSKATCQVLVIYEKAGICGVFAGTDVALVRRKVKDSLETRTLRFVRGFSLEYVTDDWRQQIFTDPDAFQEAIKRPEDYRDCFVVDSGRNESHEKENDLDFDLPGLFH